MEASRNELSASFESEKKTKSGETAEIVKRLIDGGRRDFPGFRRAIDDCIHIVSGFRELCAAPGESKGRMSAPRFTAPEILIGQGAAMPNEDTDRYSLAVILFLVLFQNHPLEGKRSLVPCLTEDIVLKLYGSEPLFICEPGDGSNAPLRNSPVMERWGHMPDYVKDTFMDVFGQEALKEPGRRPSECDWLHMLVRFRNDVVICSCGNEVVVRDGATAVCGHCGKQMRMGRFLKLPGYSIAAVKGSRVYRCQAGICKPDLALDPALLVVAKSDGTLGVKNMTQGTLGAFTPSGNAKQVPPEEVIPFKPGIKIEVYDGTIEFVQLVREAETI